MYKNIEDRRRYDRELKRRLRKENPEKFRAYNNARYNADPTRKLNAAKKSRMKNIEKEREADRQYHHRNKEKRSASNKAYRQRNKEELSQKVSKNRIKRMGLTFEQYDDILTQQNNCCKLCGNPFEKETPRIDHDHITGLFRGLIHNRCNLLIGLAFDNSIYLQMAANYIQEADKNPTGIMTPYSWTLK